MKTLISSRLGMGKTETMAISNRKYSMTPIQLFKKNQKIDKALAKLTRKRIKS